MDKNDLTNLEHMRQTAMAARKLIGEVAAAAAEAIEALASGGLDITGTAGQVIGFDADGKAVAQALANNMLPVVDIAHGGTGKNTPAKAMTALISPCAQFNLTSASQLEGMYIPAADSTEAAGKVHLKNLRLAMVGGESPIVSGQTDYTASRARAISLHATMPTTSLVNGCLYGIYS